VWPLLAIAAGTAVLVGFLLWMFRDAGRRL
jgi:nitrate reductase NapE component